MSEYEKIEKKQKRSTINDALIAANLGSIIKSMIYFLESSFKK